MASAFRRHLNECQTTASRQKLGTFDFKGPCQPLPVLRIELLAAGELAGRRRQT